MDYSKSAAQIIAGVGGKENIEAVVHCVTRLRFTLKDDSLAKENELKKIKEVKGVMNAGGQYQVIIGVEVAKVFDEVIKVVGVEGNKVKGTASNKKMNVIDKVCNLAAGIFTPLLYTMSAAGMIKAVLAIATAFGWMSTTSTEYVILNFISDAYFYFIPIFIAHTAGKKFNVNPYTSMLLAVIMLSPTWATLIADGETVVFFGISFKAVSYAQSVVPIILVVWLQSYVEPFIEKCIPDVLKMIICPAVIVLVCSVAGFSILGPIGSYIGEVLSGGINILNENIPIAIPILYGALSPLLIILGLHTIFIPILVVNIAAIGYDPSIIPASFAANLAIAGVTCAIALKARGPKTKSLAIGGALQAALGKTEASIYGLLLPLKTPLYAAMIGGAIGGVFAGLTKVKAYAMVGVGVTGIPSLIAPDGSMNNLIFGISTMLIGFFVGFIIQMKLGFDDEKLGLDVLNEEQTSNEGTKKISLCSPVKGKIIDLSEVNDKTFSDKILGQGVAIIPEDDVIYAPADGVIQMVFPTKHAVGLSTVQGMEVLIHIGIDTVKLDGKGFESFVHVGDSVKQGDKLIKIDKTMIEREGFDLTTLMIVTNSDQYFDFSETEKKEVETDNVILTVI